MLGRCGISPFAGGALAAVGSFESNEQAASWRIRDVTDQPITAFAATVGEIVAAHRFGIARETVRQFGGLGRHGQSSVTPPAAQRSARADDAPSRRQESSARLCRSV